MNPSDKARALSVNYRCQIRANPFVPTRTSAEKRSRCLVDQFYVWHLEGIVSERVFGRIKPQPEPSPSSGIQFDSNPLGPELFRGHIFATANGPNRADGKSFARRGWSALGIRSDIGGRTLASDGGLTRRDTVVPKRQLVRSYGTRLENHGAADNSSTRYVKRLGALVEAPATIFLL